MRKAGPILIAVIGVLALIICFFPNLYLPDASSPTGSRLIETKLGLDLQGGLRVEYQALPVDGKEPTPEDMAVMKDIVERRVNATGVSEAVVVVQGSDRIVVELPGVTDAEAVRQLVGQTGRLDFVPLGTTQMQEGQTIDLETYPPLFSGDQIQTASIGQDTTGGLTVDFVLKDEGAKLFADYTAANIGELLRDRARWRRHLRAGHPELHPERSGPDLGRRPRRLHRRRMPTTWSRSSSSVRCRSRCRSSRAPRSAPRSARSSSIRACIAGLIGILLVVTFMLLYYRLPGLVASFALVYYTIVVYAIFRLIPVTLTLAGVAGFVLSIGMAVDANILIFERMKEELRLGKSLPAAVEAGFNRAWNSILDSNVSSLITATILYSLGSSAIRGFALVLIIGVLVSMFSAIVVTRSIMRFDRSVRLGPQAVAVRDARGRVPGPRTVATDEPARCGDACLTSSASAAGSTRSRWPSRSRASSSSS